MSSVPTEIDINHIMKLIPHRYPFLLIDRLTEIKVDESAVGIKNVTINEPFFPGHFPVQPVMPGVLIVEAMAQTAAALAVLTIGEEECKGKIVYFMTVDGCKFRRPVGPGDQLQMLVEKERARGSVWKFKGTAKVNGQVVAQANFGAMIADADA